MNRIRTDILEIAFEEGGPPDRIPVLLLHGWPDSPRGSEISMDQNLNSARRGSEEWSPLGWRQFLVHDRRVVELGCQGTACVPWNDS
jgi:hypothetical protein